MNNTLHAPDSTSPTKIPPGSPTSPSGKSLKRQEFISFVTASLLGVLFHFVYDWSGQNATVGLFFPVNESTWEHLKLAFFPILLVSFAEYYIGGFPNICFACIKLQSALLAMATIVILFYTYTGILGKSVDWVNIAVYIVSMAIAYLYSYQKLSTGNVTCNSSRCIIGATVLIILFMVFSVYPPDIGLFRSPTP